MSNMDNYLNQITNDIPEDDLLSVQEAQENGYIGLWKGKRAEVHAKTSYDAQQKLVPVFQKMAGRKKVKRTDISVHLAEKGGKQVVHNATEELVTEAKDNYIGAYGKFHASVKAKNKDEARQKLLPILHNKSGQVIGPKAHQIIVKKGIWGSDAGKTKNEELVSEANQFKVDYDKKDKKAIMKRLEKITDIMLLGRRPSMSDINYWDAYAKAADID